MSNYNKQCRNCQQEFENNFENFPKVSRKAGIVTGPHCKSCKKAKVKKYNANRAEAKKLWYKQNKEITIERACERQKTPEAKAVKKQWYEKNKEQIKKRSNEFTKKRRKRDPLFRVVDALRSNLNNALRGRAKGRRTLDYLTISIEEFKLYIQNKFTEGMTWENYGEWHLDHIKPISSFDHSDEEQIKLCWHYTNFQPLWAKDNLAKGCKHD